MARSGALLCLALCCCATLVHSETAAAPARDEPGVAAPPKRSRDPPQPKPANPAPAAPRRHEHGGCEAGGVRSEAARDCWLWPPCCRAPPPRRTCNACLAPASVDATLLPTALPPARNSMPTRMHAWRSLAAAARAAATVQPRAHPRAHAAAPLASCPAQRCGYSNWFADVQEEWPCTKCDEDFNCVEVDEGYTTVRGEVVSSAPQCRRSKRV